VALPDSGSARQNRGGDAEKADHHRAQEGRADAEGRLAEFADVSIDVLETLRMASAKSSSRSSVHVRRAISDPE
jgi:hypothetical protein